MGGDREALTCLRGGSGGLPAAGKGLASRVAQLSFSPAVRVRDTRQAGHPPGPHQAPRYFWSLPRRSCPGLPGVSLAQSQSCLGRPCTSLRKAEVSRLWEGCGGSHLRQQSSIWPSEGQLSSLSLRLYLRLQNGNKGACSGDSMRDTTCRALGQGLAHRMGKGEVGGDPQPSPLPSLNFPLPGLNSPLWLLILDQRCKETCPKSHSKSVTDHRQGSGLLIKYII